MMTVYTDITKPFERTVSYCNTSSIIYTRLIAALSDARGRFNVQRVFEGEGYHLRDVPYADIVEHTNGIERSFFRFRPQSEYNALYVYKLEGRDLVPSSVSKLDMLYEKTTDDTIANVDAIVGCIAETLNIEDVNKFMGFLREGAVTKQAFDRAASQGILNPAYCRNQLIELGLEHPFTADELWDVFKQTKTYQNYLSSRKTNLCEQDEIIQKMSEITSSADAMTNKPSTLHS